VRRALDGAAVSFLVLKGLPLARRLGARLDERVIVDNDVLVRRRDVERAADVIESIGYRPVGGRSLRAHLRNDFQLAYERETAAGARAILDLHWAAFTPALYPVDEELVWAHTEMYEHRDQQYRVFDRPLTLVHLAAHYAQHRFTEPRIVRQLATAWNQWQADIDVRDLAELAHHTGQTHALAYAFLVADTNGLLESPPPPPTSSVAPRLHRRFPTGRDDAPPADRDYVGAMAAMQLAPPSRWPRYVASLAFPPVETLAAITGRPAGPALYVEYAVRPVRPLWRMLRGRVAPRRA